MQTDYAHEQMIRQQLRTWDVVDDRVLDAVRAVRRDEFVPARYADLAFADLEIPIAHGETMLTPKLEGRLMQSLDIGRDDAVLCIGAGTGYLSACLGKLGARVVAYERHADLAAEAEERLHRVGLTGNIEIRAETFTRDTQPGKYDAIAVTGSVAELPANLPAALSRGGRLFVVVGTGVIQRAQLITASGDGDLAIERLFETELKPLVGFGPQPQFRF